MLGRQGFDVYRCRGFRGVGLVVFGGMYFERVVRHDVYGHMKGVGILGGRVMETAAGCLQRVWRVFSDEVCGVYCV